MVNYLISHPRGEFNFRSGVRKKFYPKTFSILVFNSPLAIAMIEAEAFIFAQKFLPGFWVGELH